jgi:hypothetical protein
MWWTILASKQFLQVHGMPFTKYDQSALNNQQHVSDHLWVPPIPNKVNNTENPEHKNLSWLLCVHKNELQKCAY